MIICTLEGSGLYGSLHPRLAGALEYLRGLRPQELADGRTEVEGDDVFVTAGTHGLRPAADAPLEAHDAYIDIQLVIAGEENYGWRDRRSCARPRGGFDTARDIVFFDDAPATFFTLGAGRLAIFFPDDAHAPLVGRGEVRKCVVKVRI